LLIKLKKDTGINIITSKAIEKHGSWNIKNKKKESKNRYSGYLHFYM